MSHKRKASRETQTRPGSGGRGRRAPMVPRAVPAGQRRTNQFSGYAVPGGSRSEVKALVTSWFSAAPGGAVMACNSTGSILCVNQIQAGSSFFNRIGRKIEMKSIRLTGMIVNVSAARTTGPDYLRIMVVYDRQTNGVLPTIANILQDTDQTGTNYNSALCGINLDFRERFKVVIDKRIYLPATVSTAGGGSTYVAFTNQDNMIMDEFRKINGLQTHYKADSGPAVIGDVATGGLYILSQSENIAAGTEAWELVWDVRLRYCDT